MLKHSLEPTRGNILPHILIACKPNPGWQFFLDEVSIRLTVHKSHVQMWQRQNRERGEQEEGDWKRMCLEVPV